MRGKKIFFTGLLLVGLALVLAACGTSTPTLPPPAIDTEPCPPAVTCPECPTCPTPTDETAVEPALEVPYLEAWQESPHADETAEAFIHWNEEDPQEVPVDCATCHSSTGYIDYVGADGSAVFSVEAPAPVGTVITCATCHNAGTASLTEVPFPSGAVLTDFGDEGRCMICHQGRASEVQVDAAIERAGVTGQDDTVSADLRFVNIHYYAAAATLYGSQVNGGYQYEGMAYDYKFQHVEGYDTCIGCHNPHSLEIRVDECAVCHDGAASVEDLRAIRMEGSLSDYDGDGDVDEGVAAEVAGMQEILFSSIQAYAAETAGAPIAYSSSAYPYFFDDANANGAADDGEGRYATWTPRLLRAAYNYQTSIKDPGAYAHNAKYIIELLHDSIVDLGGDASALTRNDPGHFDGTAEAFRHWDEEGIVPLGCVRCHTAVGLPLFLEEAGRNRDQVTGAVVSLEPSNGLSCTTCHTDMTEFGRYPVSRVLFPSGAILSFSDGETPADANLCLECHQGRESNASVQTAIRRAAAETLDTPTASLSFRNPHYFAAGATLFGSEAAGAFQYEGQSYTGRFLHVPGFDTCIACHDAHQLAINVRACSGCHPSAQSADTLDTIRAGASVGVDFDGDGDVNEGVAGEIETMHEALYAAIQEYAVAQGAPILYDAHRYPYFISDPNGNGVVDQGEGNYTSWTPRLLAAAYNYQWVAKDPGSYAHNADYILQVLYDSLADMDVDVTGMTRPAAP